MFFIKGFQFFLQVNASFAREKESVNELINTVAQALNQKPDVIVKDTVNKLYAIGKSSEFVELRSLSAYTALVQTFKNSDLNTIIPRTISFLEDKNNDNKNEIIDELCEDYNVALVFFVFDNIDNATSLLSEIKFSDKYTKLTESKQVKELFLLFAKYADAVIKDVPAVKSIFAEAKKIFWLIIGLFIGVLTIFTGYLIVKYIVLKKKRETVELVK
ncbi:hypothetical protein EHP00_983 [Ecytonucleospora hepatopenaei]|uniref:Transmembrane protein n=1 Tax=Ecytonucleospora hepatopenaei TaxID=646526 RepID=A0A1W0E621_9MICR|nr:hypothetical protein EHP00_983 [Ecytonucleospora hepatopenaei]